MHAALGGKKEGPIGGRLPKEWSNCPCFTIVRNPFTRFLSGLNMFRMGAVALNNDDFYSQPRLPDLTAAQAMDILEDHKIPYDRSRRQVRANLKHHLWLQTHPFSCLHLAGTVLRYENLEEDFQRFCDKHGIDAELPHLRQTASIPEATAMDELSASDIERFQRLFIRDFTELGYSLDPSACNAPPGKTAAIPVSTVSSAARKACEAWPQYFFPGQGNDGDSLPDADIDLSAFLELPIPGPGTELWTRRLKNPIRHFKHLEPEFGGRSRLAHLLACTIVIIRRNSEDENARKLFWRIVNEYGQQVSEQLDSRWLTSVCDTVVDIAEKDIDRVLGLTGTLFSNTIKLTETYTRVFLPPVPWPPKKQYHSGGKLYDGIIAFWIQQGDAIGNLLDRIDVTLSVDSPVAPFVREIITHVIEHDNNLSRIMGIAGTKPRRIVKPEQRKKLKKFLEQL